MIAPAPGPAEPLGRAGAGFLAEGGTGFRGTSHRIGTPPARHPLMSRYRLGRSLQFLGLIVLPFGIASELMDRVGLGQSLAIAGGGALLFYVGYLIQPRP